MLSHKVILFSILIVYNGAFYHGFSQDDKLYSVDKTAFAPGEKLTYVLSYNWFFIWTDVGEVTFSVASDVKFGQDALHLHTLGKSYPFYDWFFKVRDVYESWVDPVSLRPIYFNRDINEGGYTKENEYFFDWEKGIVNARIRRKKGANKFYDIEVKPGTYDVVTAIYVARNINFGNLQKGQSFSIDVILDREVYNVNYRFIGKEQKHVKDLGTVSTLKFRVELIAGDVFKKGQYLFVWVSDDANRVPVFIESPIRVGSVKARLATYSGLMHDFVPIR